VSEQEDDDVVQFLQGFAPPPPRAALREEVLAARPPRAWPWAELVVLLAIGAGIAANVLARNEAISLLDPPRAPTVAEREAEVMARREGLDGALGRRLVATLGRRPRQTPIRVD
jgi:hypothetical protein